MRQVSEGAQNEPNPANTSTPLNQLDTNEAIEEQSNPQVLNHPQQQPLEELLPLVPVLPPALPEENQPTATTRSG